MNDIANNGYFLQLKKCDLELGNAEILKNINLDIKEGEFISIIGPSGCGKSTTLRIMCGLLEPKVNNSEAGIFFRGEKPRVAMAFQKPALLPWLTVRQNIEMSLSLGPNQLVNSLRRSKADYVLNLVELRAFSNYYPKQLSGGMQQRVALARTDRVIVLSERPATIQAVIEISVKKPRSEILSSIVEDVNYKKSIDMIRKELYLNA